MGETADQTRAEIVQLRAEMSERVVGLRRAAQRPVRIARAVAIGATVAIVVGAGVLIVARARRKAEEDSIKALPKKVGRTIGHPMRAAGKTAQQAGDGARDRLRAEIRKELEKELKASEPLPQRLLQTATKAAAAAAVGAAMRSFQDRSSKAAPRDEGGSARRD